MKGDTRRTEGEEVHGEELERREERRLSGKAGIEERGGRVRIGCPGEGWVSEEARREDGPDRQVQWGGVRHLLPV